jgi:hypothetical protein
MSADATQNQAQTQQQTVTISVESAGDPELEQRIFSSVHSVGRQLGFLSAVVELLLASKGDDPGFAATEEERKAVSDFRRMRGDILRAKSLRDPERLIRQLEALKQIDQSAFSALRERLQTFFAEP